MLPEAFMNVSPVPCPYGLRRDALDHTQSAKQPEHRRIPEAQMQL